MKIGARFIAVAMCALLLPSCAKDLPLTDASTLEKMPIYRVGPGDQVRLNVYNEPNLSGEFVIASDGTLSVPLLGPIAAAGLTLEELRMRITAGLGVSYVNNPQVTAQVIAFRPFYVMGEVERPGRYPITDGVTLVRAIATAGGFSYRANKNYAYLRRADQPEIKVELDADFQVLPGDVIRIGERYF